MATVWSMSNRTDGRIERADLPLIPTFVASAVVELVSLDLWTPDGPDAWVIADYARDQTTRAEFEVLDNARRRDREKKQRQRAAKKASASAVPGESTRGQSPGTAQARQARKARQVLGEDEGEAIDEVTGEIVDWPARMPGDLDEAWVSPDAPGVVIGRPA